MHNQFKAQATAIIIAIVALIIAAGSGYLVLHNRSQKVVLETTTTISPTTTQEPTITITEETTTTKSKVPTNILYKTTYDDGSLMSRFYKSIDGGKHWILLVEAYKGKILFAFDHRNPNIVYYTDGTFNMMAEGGGVSVSKSVDGGSHWKDISSGIITEYKKEHGF